MSDPAIPEGFELEADHPPIPEGFELEQPPSVAADVAKESGKGLVRGAGHVLGMLGDFRDLIDKGVAAGGHALGLPDPDPAKMAQAPNLTGLLPSSESVTPASATAAPQTTAGKYAGNVAEFLPGALLPGGEGSMLAKALKFGVAPGVASQAAGDVPAIKGTPYEGAARLAASLITPGLVSKGITPVRAVDDAVRNAHVDTLRNEGVAGLTAGQATGSRPLQWLESVLADTPFSGRSAEGINTTQAEQYTRAALRNVGENAPRATPEVIDNAYNRIGGEFDRLSANNRMEGDAHLGNEFNNTWIDYASHVPPSARAPIVENTIREIGNVLPANGGSIPGDVYQSLRSRLSRAARGTKDPELSGALHDLHASLDDAMERSIGRNNPADAGDFATARRQYRNMQVIERAATAAGAGPASGLISPAGLASATKQLQGRRAFARGQGDFHDLARAGDAVMRPLPQSGTAPRENVMHNLQLLTTLLGAGGGAELGGVSGGLAGIAAGIGAPAVAGRAILSRPGQAYLGNQLMGQLPGLLSLPGAATAATGAQGLLSPY